MAEVVTLDTSAFLTLTGDEPGADTVQQLVMDALAGKIVLHAAFVMLAEIEYITLREEGEDAARRRLADVKTLPVHWHHSDDEWCAAAAKLKAKNAMSLADAFVAALARRLHATLVHKDPEFAVLGPTVKQQMLPPKVGLALLKGRPKAAK